MNKPKDDGGWPETDSPTMPNGPHGDEENPARLTGNPMKRTAESPQVVAANSGDVAPPSVVNPAQSEAEPVRRIKFREFL